MQDQDAIRPRANPSGTRAGVRDETAELFGRVELYRRALAGITDAEAGQIRSAFERVREDLEATLPRASNRLKSDRTNPPSLPPESTHTNRPWIPVENYSTGSLQLASEPGASRGGV